MRFVRLFTAAAYLAAATTASAFQLEINGEIPKPQQSPASYRVVACPMPEGKLTLDLTVCREFIGPDGQKYIVRGETINPAQVRANLIESERMVDEARRNSAEIRALAAQAKAMRDAAEAQRQRAGGQPSRVGN